MKFVAPFNIFMIATTVLFSSLSRAENLSHKPDMTSPTPETEMPEMKIICRDTRSGDILNVHLKKRVSRIQNLKGPRPSFPPSATSTFKPDNAVVLFKVKDQDGKIAYSVRTITENGHISEDSTEGELDTSLAKSDTPAQPLKGLSWLSCGGENSNEEASSTKPRPSNRGPHKGGLK